MYLSYYDRVDAFKFQFDNKLSTADNERGKERVIVSAKSSSHSSIGLTKQMQQQQKALQAKRDKEARARERQMQSIRKAAWVAIRTAGIISKAQKTLEALSNDAIVGSDEARKISAPDFSLFEIMKTDVFIRDSETGLLTNENGLVKINNRFGNYDFFMLSWSHLVTYGKNLRRKTGYAAMGHGSSLKSCIRSAFGTERTALKIELIHNLLRESLSIYDKECCPILPMDLFLDWSFTPAAPVIPTINVTIDSEAGELKRLDKTASTDSVPEMVPITVNVIPKDDEIQNTTGISMQCCLWYFSSLSDLADLDIFWEPFYF